MRARKCHTTSCIHQTRQDKHVWEIKSGRGRPGFEAMATSVCQEGHTKFISCFTDRPVPNFDPGGRQKKEKKEKK